MKKIYLFSVICLCILIVSGFPIDTLVTPSNVLQSIPSSGRITYVNPEPDTYVFDVSQRIFPTRLLATTLEGIVNRQADSGQVYLIFSNNDWRWLNYYSLTFRTNYEVVDNVYYLLNATRKWITGFVVYDPEVPCSTDIAATIAGLNGSIVISPSMIEEVEKCGIRMDYDLRGKFKGLSKIQVYEWGYEYLWSKCSRKVIGNTHRHPNRISLNLTEHLRNSDSVYVRFEDAYPKDGFGADLCYAELQEGLNGNIIYIIPETPVESDFMYDSGYSWINPAGQRIADCNQSWIYEFNLGKNTKAQLAVEIYQQYQISVALNPEGPWNIVASNSALNVVGTYPQIIDYIVSKRAFIMSLSSTDSNESLLKEMFLSDMTPLGLLLGWHNWNDDSESAYVKQASENGLMALCCLEAPNFSFHSKVKPSITFSQPEPDLRRTRVENKVYLTFVVSDGDALWTGSSSYLGSWSDSSRGKVSLGWEIQPLLFDLAPGILQYYYETREDTDEFVASMSGIGYIHPDDFAPNLFQSYLTETNLYLEKLDLRTLFVLPRDSVSDNLVGQYSSQITHCIGFFEGYGPIPGNPTQTGNVVWFRTKYSVDPKSLPTDQKIADDLEVLANQAGDRPFFITVHALVAPELCNKIYAVFKNLDADKFEIVTPSKFASLALNYLTSSS